MSERCSVTATNQEQIRTIHALSTSPRFSIAAVPSFVYRLYAFVDLLVVGTCDHNYLGNDQMERCVVMMGQVRQSCPFPEKDKACICYGALRRQPLQSF